jgi:hypothetical protein
MKQSDWINVHERLPNKGDFMIVCRECNGERWWDIAGYVRDGFLPKWYDTRGFDIHDVTHWMNIVLPEKTKHESKN